jgi:hypothetical protein
MQHITPYPSVSLGHNHPHSLVNVSIHINLLRVLDLLTIRWYTSTFQDPTNQLVKITPRKSQKIAHRTPRLFTLYHPLALSTHNALAELLTRDRHILHMIAR